MQVRTDAWHYKVWAWSHLEKSDSKRLDAVTSLCPYFWRVMLALAWLPPVVALLLLGKICFVPLKCFLDCRKFQKEMLHPFYSFKGYGVVALAEGILGILFLFIECVLVSQLIEAFHTLGSIVILKVFIQILILIGIAVLAIIIIIGFFYALDKFNEWKNAPAENQSLLLSYFSAVKQKVCPRIEFVNSGSNQADSSS